MIENKIRDIWDTSDSIHTEEEKEALKSLDKKQIHIKSVVQNIVAGYETGLFLSGDGGIGKTYTVVNELIRLNAPYRLHNSKMTARALVEELFKYPNHIHVIDDAETLMRNKDASGLLRSALSSIGNDLPRKRRINWNVKGDSFSFDFTGGIIIISNANLPKTAEIEALETRITPLRLTLTTSEILVLMKEICLKGFDCGNYHLEPVKCFEVKNFIVRSLNDMDRKLNIRFLIKGFETFIAYENGNCETDWKELMMGMMIKTTPQYKSARTEKKDLAQLALEIWKMDIEKKDKLAIWSEKAGLDKEASRNTIEKNFTRALNRANKFF